MRSEKKSAENWKNSFLYIVVIFVFTGQETLKNKSVAKKNIFFGRLNLLAFFGSLKCVFLFEENLNNFSRPLRGLRNQFIFLIRIERLNTKLKRKSV